jgi:serine/threonine-protein kinase
MELRRGGRIGDYDLLDEIGRGGMAQVWSVRDARSGNGYAVKTLLPEFAGDAALQERLLREARNQCQLQHPSIVRAYGTFQSEGRTFILMELVNGESLETYLTRRRPLPMPEVRGIARAVLSGLGYAHSMRLVHRDLKPSNILLSNNGAIQIADFGIALLLGQKRLTKFGAMGTPAYMSPEQIRTPLGIDERSDIYSFACVLYELVSGYPPFHFESGENDYLVREAHLTRKPQSLTRHQPDTPAAFDEAILRALEKDPAARFPSCEEFAAALGLQIETGMQAPTPRSRVVQGAGFRATPSAPSAGEGAAPRVVTPKSGAPRAATPRPSTPPKPPPEAAPRAVTPAAGAARARPTPGAGGASTPAPSGLMRDKQRLAGIVAISAAAVMLLAVVILSIHRSHPAAAPAGPAPTAETAAVEPAAPDVEEGKKAPATDGESKPSGRSAENAGGGLPRSEPAAIAPLRRLFEEAKESAVPASGEASPIGNRPQPLGPPPTVNQGRESGVLQWAGSTPASGGQVVIFDGTQLGGALSGDALPGVPVSVSVENPDVRITEAPSPGNGNRRLVLQAPANLNRPIRINWQVQKGSRP